MVYIQYEFTIECNKREKKNLGSEYVCTLRSSSLTDSSQGIRHLLWYLWTSESSSVKRGGWTRQFLISFFGIRKLKNSRH